MGLFKLFVPKADPMVAWSSEPGLVPDFDFNFDRHALCGIKPGDPQSLLWKLGPSEDKPAEAEGNHNYYSKGVQVAVENGVIVSFVLFWNDDRRKQFLSFKGPSNYRGQKIELRDGMSEPEIARIFGEAYWRGEDEDEIILFYEFGGIEWQVEISHRAGLTAMVVLTPPLLENEEQRNAYNVTKPWPPPSQAVTP
jgi:hypothetical protein